MVTNSYSCALDRVGSGLEESCTTAPGPTTFAMLFLLDFDYVSFVFLGFSLLD